MKNKTKFACLLPTKMEFKVGASYEVQGAERVNSDDEIRVRKENKAAVIKDSLSQGAVAVAIITIC